VIELRENAEDIDGWTTTRTCYFACSDIERCGLVVVAVVVVGASRRSGREGGNGEGVGEIDGARGDDPNAFCVLSSIVDTIVGRRPTRRARSVVLFRVFERIGRRRRLQPRHGVRQQTQDDGDGDGDGDGDSDSDSDGVWKRKSENENENESERGLVDDGKRSGSEYSSGKIELISG